MRFFSRKNKKRQSSEFNHGNGLMTSFDKMVYFVVESRKDEELLRLCDTIIASKPVLANFDKLTPDDCNYMLAFISGVIYACDGETIRLGERLFLFARKEEYEDGSLRQYVEDIK